MRSKINIFISVAETETFSKTAEKLSLQRNFISKKVSALEADVGFRLFNRSKSYARLTNSGRDFYNSVRNIDSNDEALESFVSQTKSGVSGQIRLNITPLFGQIHVMSKLENFLLAYPDITIETSVLNRRIDLVAEGIDIAISHEQNYHDSSQSCVLRSDPFVTVALKGYIDKFGFPNKPSDLKGHNCLALEKGGDFEAWEFEKNLTTERHFPKGNLKTANPEHLRAAVLSGLGIAHVPRWIFEHELNSEIVCHLLSSFESKREITTINYPPKKNVSAKTRLLVDFISNQFRKSVQDNDLPPLEVSRR